MNTIENGLAGRLNDAKQRITEIESMVGKSEIDNQDAMVLALCEIAYQLARLGDFLETS